MGGNDDGLIDSSMAVDQSVSNFDNDDIPTPIIEEKEETYVPDVEKGHFVAKDEPSKRTFTLKLNIGLEGENLDDENLPKMI